MEYISYDEIVESFKPGEIEAFLRVGTAVRPNDILQLVVSKMLPTVENIVEIGTCFGLSAMVMASCKNVKNVWTFDVKYDERCFEIWEKFDVWKKIRYFVLKDGVKIHKMIESLDFDFAYVDGNHEEYYARRDLEVVKKCGRILIDDYDGQQIEKVVKEIGGRKLEDRFGIWVSDGNYWIVDELASMGLWKEPKNTDGNILKLDFRHLEGK